MNANQGIQQSIDYWLQTYPLDAPGTSRKQITVGTPGVSGPNFWIKHLTFNMSTIDPVNSGQVTITFDDPTTTDIYGLIKEGDCFRLFEVFGNNKPAGQQSTAAVFTGYIASVSPRIAVGANAGTEVTYYFYNLLGQWAQQTAINTFNGQVSQGLTNLNSNQIPLGQVLSTLVEGSLFQFLLSTPGASQFPQVANLLSPDTSYKGIPLPVILGPGSLQLTDLVWTYIATNMTKIDALSKVLYPYQEIFYQDGAGTIHLGYLNTGQRNTNKAFNFERGQTLTNNSPYGPTPNFTSIEIMHAAAMIPNQIITSLVNLPFFPPTSGKPSNFLGYMNNPFTRPKQLLDSGFYQVTEVDVDAISPNMITDPTLLSLLRVNLPETNYNLLNVSGQPTVAGTYSARRLAQANIKDTTVIVTQPRSMTAYAGDSPLGMMVNLGFPTLLDSDSSQLYCHTTTTTFDTTGTTFMLELCKSGSVTAYWAKNG